MDLSALFGDITPGPDAHLEAMRRLGLLGQVSGDKVLSGVGESLQQQAQQEVAQRRQAAMMGQQIAKENALEQYRAEEIKARNRGLDQQKEAQDAREEVWGKRIDALNRAAALRGIRYNPNTGEFENVTHLLGKGAAPSPSPAPAPAPQSNPQPAGAPAPAPTLGAPLRGPGFQPMSGRMLDKALKDFGADLDTNKGTGEIQKNQARLNAAIRLRKLVTDEGGNVKQMIPPQFMKETAMALAQLINSGGQPAQSLIEELTPHSKSSKLADVLQWITDNPQNAGQQNFVKLYLESANREAVAAQEALNKAVGSRVGKHQRLIKSNPEQARIAAQGYGWTLDPEKMTLTPVQTADVAAGAVEPGAAPAAGPVKVKTIEEARALPKGTRFVDPNGVERVR